MGSDGGLAVTRPGLLGAAASARPAPWASVGALGAGADGSTWAASASGSTMGCCRRRWEGTVALATRRRGVVQGRSAGAAEGRGHRLWPEHVEAVRGDLCTCSCPQAARTYTVAAPLPTLFDTVHKLFNDNKTNAGTWEIAVNTSRLVSSIFLFTPIYDITVVP